MAGWRRLAPSRIFQSFSMRKLGLILLVSAFKCSAASYSDNDVMMQAFYWNVPVNTEAGDGFWWDTLSSQAHELKESGFTALWTPVPSKGNWGIIDNGYGVYDHYDLGNYYQKGSTETRFGSRSELERMLEIMHTPPRINVFSDVVLNHMYASAENREYNPFVTEYALRQSGIKYPEDDIFWIKDRDSVKALTPTFLYYPIHRGVREPNYQWHYWHFHPSSFADWLDDFGNDEIKPRAKFFGNDLDTFNSEVQQRLCDWGRWLYDVIGFDGFRLDFVRGFQEEFAAKWINNLPKGTFIVGEYWGGSSRIKNWVDSLASYGADVHAFDFPLKKVLTEMCNSTEFDMRRLCSAGLIMNSDGNNMLPQNVVTFIENHDTGKEHDKWVKRDYHLGYAYILTHQGCPCVFYPHFFSTRQYDHLDESLSVQAPEELKDRIKQLMRIRKRYLGGECKILKTDVHLYIARREGDTKKAGGMIFLNSDPSESISVTVDVNAPGFTNWAGKKLINLLDESQSTVVDSEGRALLSAPPRDYSIWVPSDCL